MEKNELFSMSLREAATRPDFIKLMSVGLKTKMFDAYNNAPSEYEELVSPETSTKDKETYPSLSGVAEPEKVLEGERFPELDVGEMQDVEITNYKFGRLMAITREMVDDDQTKKIKNQPLKIGQGHRNYENRVVFSAIVDGETAATCYDGLAIYTANHLNRKGGTANANNDNILSAVTLSAGSITVALGYINLWKGLDDEVISVNAKMLVVSDRLSYAANWLMSPTGGIPAYASNDLGAASTVSHLIGRNPISAVAMLKVKTCKWLTKIGGTAADFYIWTDVPGWVFQVRDKLELTKEGNLSESYFERDIMRWKSRKRFGFKNIDWRASMKVTS